MQFSNLRIYALLWIFLGSKYLAIQILHFSFVYLLKCKQATLQSNAVIMEKRKRLDSKHRRLSVHPRVFVLSTSNRQLHNNNNNNNSSPKLALMNLVTPSTQSLETYLKDL